GQSTMYYVVATQGTTSTVPQSCAVPLLDDEAVSSIQLNSTLAAATHRPDRFYPIPSSPAIRSTTSTAIS
ncbi:hypothetical protein XPA_010739, partial [Xanthoria parietina]